jgi:hypothetical protein
MPPATLEQPVQTWRRRRRRRRGRWREGAKCRVRDRERWKKEIKKASKNEAYGRYGARREGTDSGTGKRMSER